MSPSLFRILGNVCFVSGFASIIASILVWAFLREPDAPHAELDLARVLIGLLPDERE